jgi:hypothetical protein
VAWSPDARQIVFLYYEGGQEKVLLINADGSGEPELLEQDMIEALEVWLWFPDSWPQWATISPTIAVETPPTPKPTATPTEEIEVSNGDGDAVVSILVTYLREQPEPSAKAGQTLQKGDSVDLLAVNQDKTWVQARAFGHVGWVSIDDLKLNISLDELAVEEVAAIPTPTPPPTSTPLPTHTPVPPPTNTPKPACPYQADTDAATITNLIHAEAEAINKEDISIIQAIFAPDAYSQYIVTGEEWRDPISRYTGLFEIADFTDAVHFDIQPTGEGITADTAWFISGSSGIFIPNDGEPVNYYNEPGKDSWVLKKNHVGCWVIVEFRFH